ncbi:MAG: bacterial Ig-like domain-containing protein [Clostridia bacterium]|nr:bacterial Ig-like domain-containing protein [Clostridia bacterium]
MKKSKKLLSILLAVVMVFSVVAVPVSAAVPSNVQTLESLIQPSNLAGLVDWLLTSLNNRKEKYADSVLNFVCTFVEDIKAEVPEGTNVFNDNIATSTKATYVMNYLDKMIQEQNLNEKLGEDIQKILDAVNAISFGALTIDLSDLDGILATIKSIDGVKDILGGDIKQLNLDSLIIKKTLGTEAQSRSKTGDLKIIYNLIQFLADNINIFKKFLAGNLDLGLIGDVAGDLQDTVNGFAGEITIMIKDLVYEKLLGAPDGKASHAESAYKDWTVDQMAIGALVKMLTGAVPADTDEINNFLNKPVYDLLAYYGDRLYDSFLVDILQNDLMGVIKQYAEGNALAQYFNMDVTFTGFANDLAGKVNFAENGIFAEVNNLVVALLEKVIASDVFVKLGLVTGGNENLNANLEKVIKYILPRMAAILDPAEFDFSMYTQDYVAEKTLAELAPGILKIFYPGWFHLEAEEIDVVEQIDTMGEAAALAVYYALISFNEVMFTTEGAYDYVSEWNSMIFEADGKTLKDLGNSEWGNICLSMAADAAMFGFILNGENLFFGWTMDDIKAAKADKWTAEEFLDEIADWAINMVKGVPAVADHFTAKRGELDGYGPFYKLNVLLNEILDWSFLNGASRGSFNLDIETLVFDSILAKVYKFDIAGVLDLFAINGKTGNVLNLNTVPALLSIVDNVLNVLFSHTGNQQKVTVPATCANIGFSVTACTKCGLYQGGYSETAKTEHKTVTEILKASSCGEEGLVRYTCENCDYVLRKVTDALEHKYDIEAVERDGKWYFGNICANCGEAEGELEEAPVISQINIKYAPAVDEYELNSDAELDLTGLVIETVYADGYTAELKEENYSLIEVLTELDLTKAGEQIITISYLGCQATFTVTVVDNSEPEYLLGDATGDGKVDAGDARAALRHSVALELLTGVKEKAADYNCDNRVDASDARAILRFSVGLNPFG